MKRYKITLKGSNLSWYEYGIGPTEAAAKVCAKLNEDSLQFGDESRVLNTYDFWVEVVDDAA